MAFSSQHRRMLTRPSERLATISVLVLDSNPDAMKIYREVLEQLGFTDIHTAATAYEGIQALKQDAISLVLADVELRLENKTAAATHGMGGISMIRRLRLSPISPNPFLPVIALLDPDNSQQEAEARDAGVTEMLRKPLQAAELCTRITDIVEHPRLFITAQTYKGPCRRRLSLAPPEGMKERRSRSVCILRYDDLHKGTAHQGAA